MTENKKRNKYFNLILAAIFAALTVVTTMIHIPVPLFTNEGYLHFGDAVIYLAASILPTGYACAAAAVGGGMADLFSQAALWAPATIIIKALLALTFTSKKDRFICKRNIIALVICCFITIAGYYAAEAVIYGNWATPVIAIAGNSIQAVGSAAIYLIVATALDKIKLKNKIAR